MWSVGPLRWVRSGASRPTEASLEDLFRWQFARPAIGIGDETNSGESLSYTVGRCNGGQESKCIRVQCAGTEESLACLRAGRKRACRRTACRAGFG